MKPESVQAEFNAVQSSNDSFLQGIKDCIPTLLGYLSIGFAAGVVEKTAGLSLGEIAMISVILYAGSAQFIAAGMIAAGSTAPSIIITILQSISAICCLVQPSRPISGI